MITPSGSDMGLKDNKAILFDELREKIDQIGYAAVERNPLIIGDLDALLAALIDLDYIVKKS